MIQVAGKNRRISSTYNPNAAVSLFVGDCMELFSQIPDETCDLVVTSPPYNLGKEYEKATDIGTYVAEQTKIIDECVRILSPHGSICWQVGNFVDRGRIVPLDIALYPVFAKHNLIMRNRIVWHFEHGLHCSRRFSGRYEVISWFTKTDDYIFNVDPIRIPQKYPGKKHFKGPRAGQYSCNPLGKNPGDVWIIPNVKANHVEKTFHPCQFPVELIERLVLSMTEENSLVVDPFMGVGSSAIAAIRHCRRAAGAEILPKYAKVARQRIELEFDGLLKTRPMGKPVHQPTSRDSAARKPIMQDMLFGE